MKRTLSILFTLAVALFALAPALHASSGKSYTIRGSYFAPEGAKAGFTIGGGVGMMIDENVEIGIGTDIYYKNYRKTTRVATVISPGGVVTDTDAVLLEYNTFILPVMLELMIKFPVFPRGSVFGHAGLGYEFLFNKVDNFAAGISDRDFYSGFTWQLGGGFMIKLGNSSSLFVEGFYDWGRPKRNLKDPILNMPVYESVNLSGFGARVGLSLGPL